MSVDVVKVILDPDSGGRACVFSAKVTFFGVHMLSYASVTWQECCLGCSSVNYVETKDIMLRLSVCLSAY